MIATWLRLSDIPDSLQRRAFSHRTARVKFAARRRLTDLSLDRDLGPLGVAQAARGTGHGDGIVAGWRVG